MFFLLCYHEQFIYITDSNSECAEEPKYILPHHDNSQAYLDKFFQGAHTFAENAVKLTVICVKFNYGPAVDAFCVTQGDWREAAARWQPCRQQRAQITMAWAAAKSRDSAITQPTNTPRAAHGHSSQTLSP